MFAYNENTISDQIHTKWAGKTVHFAKETEQKMYYTTSGAYRKSKMLIDYATIALTAVIMILFILILFLRSNSGILFPIVFLAGALINGLSGIKAFMNKKRLSGVFLIIAAVILLIVSAAVGLAVL